MFGLVGDWEIDEAERVFLCWVVWARFARRASSFSSRSALNMNSNGESRAAGDGEAREGVGITASGPRVEDAREGVAMDAPSACDEAGRSRLSPLLTVGDSAPFDRKLGRGRDEGAGDA